MPGPGWSGSAARSRAWALRRRRLVLSAAASRSARDWRASVPGLGEWPVTPVVVAPALIISAVVAPDLILPPDSRSARPPASWRTALGSLLPPWRRREKRKKSRSTPRCHNFASSVATPILALRRPCGRFRPPSRPGLLRPRSCRRSSVVEHSLGKGMIRQIAQKFS